MWQASFFRGILCVVLHEVSYVLSYTRYLMCCLTRGILCVVLHEVSCVLSYTRYLMCCLTRGILCVVLHEVSYVLSYTRYLMCCLTRAILCVVLHEVSCVLHALSCVVWSLYAQVFLQSVPRSLYPGFPPWLVVQIAAGRIALREVSDRQTDKLLIQANQPLTPELQPEVRPQPAWYGVYWNAGTRFWAWTLSLASSRSTFSQPFWRETCKWGSENW